MIANFFNKTQPVIIVNLLLLFAIFYFVSVFYFHQVVISLVSLSSVFTIFLAFVFMLLVINFILRKNKLTEDNSYTLLIIILLLGSFYETMYIKNIFFSNLVLLLSFRKIYSLNSGFNTKKKLFDAAFWIGVSTILYAWSILFLVLIYLGVFIYGKLSFKNLLVPVIGFLTPVLIFFTFHFYFDSLYVFYEVFQFDFSLNFVAYNALKFLIPISLIITLLLWSIVSLAPKVVLTSNNFKMAWQVILNHLIISLIIVLFSPIKNGSELFFLILPTAIIITNFLQRAASATFKNMILYLLLVVSVGVYFL